MHRQSLGSPASKLPLNEEETATSSISCDEYNDKSLKPQNSSLKPDRYLHVIPLLMAICFLMLYLTSHDPSQKELAEFSGFNWPSHIEDTKEFDGLNMERFIEVKRSDILGIRSLKNVQHDRDTRASVSRSEYRFHRKIANF